MILVNQLIFRSIILQKVFKFNFTQNSFIRYLLIGLLSNTLNFSTYILVFHLNENIILASILGYTLGLTASFYFGKTWAFKSLQNFQLFELIKFLLVYLVGGIGMASMTFYLNQVLGIEYKLSWIGGALFAILNNYFGSKYIVFKTSEQTTNSKFGFLSKLNFLQDAASAFIARVNPAVIHNLEKYVALKKVHYLAAIEEIEGDYLEFGVFTGSSFCHSIRCVQKLSKINPLISNTKFYGFDSFEGFGDLDSEDDHPFYKDTNFETSFEKVNSRVNKVSKELGFKLIKGFFNESLSEKPSYYGIEKSRIIFIDSDTYSSAKEALVFVTPTIQEGTYIILDDFFSYKGSERKGIAKAFKEFQDKEGIETRHVLTYGMGGVVFIISSI